MVAVRGYKNYWYAGSPLGGINMTAFKSGGPSASNIERYLAPLRLERIKQDPFTWKQALEEAEIPMPLLSYRVKMIQMYNDVMLDGHTFACMEKRKERILLKDYHIVDEKGNEDEEATKLVNQPWYKNIISYALDASGYGFTLLQIGDIVNGVPSKIKLLRRQNVSPDRLNIATVPYSPGGIQFMDEDAKDEFGEPYKDWTIWIPTPSDFGISECGYGFLYKVALYQILLRNNLGDNATYNELFGQPLRVGKTDKKDKTSRENMRRELESMGSAAYAVLDPEDKIEFITGNTGAAAANGPYDNLEQRLEKKISKIILGHADALDSTAGKLGSSGQDDDGAGKAINDKEKRDMDFIDTVLNEIVNPKLMNLGVKIPVGKRLVFKNDLEKQSAANKKTASNTAFMTLVKTAKEAGLEVDPIFVEEMTGIPVTKVVEPTPMINNPNVSKEQKAKLESLYKYK